MSKHTYNLADDIVLDIVDRGVEMITILWASHQSVQFLNDDNHNSSCTHRMFLITSPEWKAKLNQQLHIPKLRSKYTRKGKMVILGTREVGYMERDGV